MTTRHHLELSFIVSNYGNRHRPIHYLSECSHFEIPRAPRTTSPRRGVQ